MNRWRFNNLWTVLAASVLALGLITLLLWSPWERQSIGGKSIRLYCAAGMSKPVAEIIREYREQFGVEVQASYAGSGSLLSTISTQVRGQGDLFISADDSHMLIAQQKGLVAETIPVVTLHPVLVVNRKTQEELKKQGKPVAGIADLMRDDLKVVLANPEEAAIGKLIKQVLSRSNVNLWPRLEQRMRESRTAQVSTVGTVNEVARIVRTSDRYVGIIWDALARQHDDLEIIDMPEFSGVTSQVLIGVLVQSEQPTAALQFARFLTARDKGLAVFHREHFEPVADADVWAVEPEIHLSVGAMLRPGVEEVFQAFAKREGIKINTTYNGCGILVSQMKSMRRGEKPGRFPDAYFSCDTPFLADVQQWFDPGTLVSQNEAIIIVKKGNPKGVRGLGDLTRKDLKMGLAHPENSALGTLTDRILQKLGLHEQVYEAGWQDRIVHTDAAHDLVNKLRVGALDMAVVYRSNVMSTPANLEHMDIIPINVKEALATQPFAIANDTRHKYLMQRLLRAIVAKQNADYFQSLGFRWVYGTE